MKNLGNLSPAAGSNKATKRLGRGIGSGLGKTAGKGHKGQLARKGGGIRAGFEGGQTPLYKRLPKNGFTNTPFKIEWNIVNISELNKFESGTEVTAELLNQRGLLHSAKNPVKILGNGTLDKKLTVKVQKFSQSAKSAIENAGGKIEEIQ